MGSRTLKTHLFSAVNQMATLCNHANISDKNWRRSDYCTQFAHEVTCKNCRKIWAKLRRWANKPS